MLWFWGRWHFPFMQGGGCLAITVNIILLVVYLVMSLVVLMIVGAALLVLGVTFAPCWFLLLL